MGNKELKINKPSKLAQFDIKFEFNETWADARKKYSTSKK